MAKIYYALIVKGLRTLDSVPEYRGLHEEVAKLLEAEGLDGNGQPLNKD